MTVDVPLTLPDEAPALARAMAAQWAEIGIRTTIREHADREGYALRVRAKEIGDAACFDSSPLSSYRVLREKLHSESRGAVVAGIRKRRVGPSDRPSGGDAGRHRAAGDLPPGLPPDPR